MSLESIIGQPLAVDLCRQWLARQSTNPLLFYGPDGVGKRALALELAKTLNCKAKTMPPRATLKKIPSPPSGERVQDEGPDFCGCSSCRRIAHGQHPDVRVIDLEFQAELRGEPAEKQQALRIETIQSERRRLLQSAVEGPWKVSILDEAHKLTADAANGLLKILEEPPERTAIILISAFRDRLFATLVSRCQPVRFRRLSDEEMRQCLTQLSVAAEDQMRLVEMAIGSPGSAMHLNREEKIESILEAEALWQALPGQRPAAIVGRTEGRPRAAKVTRPEIQERLNDLLVPAIRSLRAGDPAAPRSVAQIQQAFQQLRQNVSPALVYEHLLLTLARQRSTTAVK